MKNLEWVRCCGARILTNAGRARQVPFLRAARLRGFAAPGGISGDRTEGERAESARDQLDVDLHTVDEEPLAVDRQAREHDRIGVKAPCAEYELCRRAIQVWLAHRMEVDPVAPVDVGALVDRDRVETEAGVACKDERYIRLGDGGATLGANVAYKDRLGGLEFGTGRATAQRQECHADRNRHGRQVGLHSRQSTTGAELPQGAVALADGFQALPNDIMGLSDDIGGPSDDIGGLSDVIIAPPGDIIALPIDIMALPIGIKGLTDDI